MLRPNKEPRHRHPCCKIRTENRTNKSRTHPRAAQPARSTYPAERRDSEVDSSAALNHRLRPLTSSATHHRHAQTHHQCTAARAGRLSTRHVLPLITEPPTTPDTPPSTRDSPRQLRHCFSSSANLHARLSQHPNAAARPPTLAALTKNGARGHVVGLRGYDSSPDGTRRLDSYDRSARTTT